MIQINAYGEEEEVGQPYCHEGGHDSADGEGGADRREEDIEGGEGESYTQVFAHTASDFAGGHGYGEQGHDESSEW